jgi:phospholipid-translocating ATPase
VIKSYQAASPDEIALVKFSEENGLYLKDRQETGDSKLMFLENGNKQEEKYEILKDFPFSSETKRMGIILRHNETGKLMFYVKGADTVMKDKVKPAQRAQCWEYCENIAKEGLRTLVISQKQITEEEYTSFINKYEEIDGKAMADKEQALLKIQQELEHDLDFLCVTGVEDKLQVDVDKTIEMIR